MLTMGVAHFDKPLKKERNGILMVLEENKLPRKASFNCGISKLSTRANCPSSTPEKDEKEMIITSINKMSHLPSR